MNKNDLINKLQLEINDLKQQLVDKEKQLHDLKFEQDENPYCNALTPDEISRYSRQIIMPDITVNGQIILKNSKVLIVGAGGLGCPASLYLTAAGVGNITIIDSDEVELSNLHRQILHYESNLGTAKVQSAKMFLNQLNNNVNITPLQMHLNSSNILEILKDFDVVVDGTDNVATRYLLNDACVLKNIPLVSGSALQFEGQLTVYHYKGGPCYRCLFPVPPPPESVTSCGDGGVLGVGMLTNRVDSRLFDNNRCINKTGKILCLWHIDRKASQSSLMKQQNASHFTLPGCIGVLQALETIKILINLPNVLSGRMLLFDGATTTFRNILLRKRSPNCAVCGENPTVKELIDYEQFCQGNAHDKGDNVNLLSSDERVTVKDYNKIITDKINHVLLDVRSKAEFEMCRLPNSINIPFTDIVKDLHLENIHKLKQNNSQSTIFVLCRRGNDSQRAVKILKEQFEDFKFRDIIGGLHAYSAKIDPRFPVY